MYYVHDKATKNCAVGISQKQCSINIADMVFTISLKGVLRQGRNVYFMPLHRKTYPGQNFYLLQNYIISGQNITKVYNPFLYFVRA